MSRGLTRWHAALLRALVPSFDSRDIAEASDDFARLRERAWQVSIWTWTGVCVREARALVATAVDHHRRARRRPERATALGYDLRHAARLFARDRFLTAMVVGSLALGIGVNAATWGVMDRLLLRGPEHVRAPGRLVRIYRRTAAPPAGERTSAWLPLSSYRQLRDRVASFESVGAYGVRDTRVGTGDDARMLRVGMTLGPFFQTLGTTPAHGRFFLPGEEARRDGALVVLSDRLWRTRFGGDLAVLGRQLPIGADACTIVGIAPPGFSGPEFGAVDAWVLGDTRVAGSYNWKVVARLRPGASAASVAPEIAAVRAVPDDTEPKWMREAALLALPVRFDDTGREPVQAEIARWLSGVSGIILLVTCANVANLLLVRLARRRREFAIRAALGSGRSRLMRLVAIEGGLLAVVGAVASVWVAGVAQPAIQRALFPDGAGWSSSVLDGRLLAIVAGIAAMAAVVTGVVPALQAGAAAPAGVLIERTGRGAARSRLRASLTLVQAALSVVLLAGAGLFVRSLANVDAIDLGSEPDRVIVVEAMLDSPPIPANRSGWEHFVTTIAARERVVYRRAVDAVRRLPGVESASLTLGLPFDSGSFTAPLAVPGLDEVPVLPGGGPYISAVAPEYFQTIGTRLLRGRDFTGADREGSEPVVVVSTTTARRLWPGQDALQKCVHVGGRSQPCARVVGVAQDVHRVSLSEEPSLQVYVPFGQESRMAGARLLVRPAAGASLDWSAVRGTIVAIEPTVSLVDLHLLSDSLGQELRPLRLGAATFGASAGLALLTAALGLRADGVFRGVAAQRDRHPSGPWRNARPDPADDRGRRAGTGGRWRRSRTRADAPRRPAHGRATVPGIAVGPGGVAGCGRHPHAGRARRRPVAVDACRADCPRRVASSRMINPAAGAAVHPSPGCGPGAFTSPARSSRE